VHRALCREVKTARQMAILPVDSRPTSDLLLGTYRKHWKRSEEED
jgi:hypothetical protein